jgi:hypothetical protein
MAGGGLLDHVLHAGDEHVFGGAEACEGRAGGVGFLLRSGFDDLFNKGH